MKFLISFVFLLAFFIVQCGGSENSSLTPDVNTGKDIKTNNEISWNACKSDEDCKDKGGVCKIAYCDETDHTCKVKNAEDGTACDDGSVCTEGDMCESGVCKPGTPKDCNDNNPCTEDSCDPLMGCVNKTVANGTECDDGNPCTINTKCQDGACVGEAKSCDDQNPCTDDSCDKETGECKNVPNTGNLCDDGNQCTENDTCQNGVCTGTEVQCPNDNPCVEATCDPDQGCVTTNLPDNTPCDDGDDCTADDHCENGVCVGTNTCQPSCGDGECNGDESCETCPQDCGECPAPVCGNNICEQGEDETSCPQDCGGEQPVCGNGQCEDGEDATNCPQDCGGEQPVCGNGTCENGENETNCPQDCGIPEITDCKGIYEPSADSCGIITDVGCCDAQGRVLFCIEGKLYCLDCANLNPQCGWNASESYYDCGTDGSADPSGLNPLTCGGGGQNPVCGNGQCENGEDATNCPQDCGGEQPVCGNGTCENGENETNCPQDCGTPPVNDCCEVHDTPGCSDQSIQDCVCAQDSYCCSTQWDDYCVAEVEEFGCGTCGGSQAECGNGVCEPGEDATTCPDDCGSQPVCGNGQCEDGEDATNCPEDCSPVNNFCDTVKDKGCCDGDVYKYCENGEIKEVDCSTLPAPNNTCGWKQNNDGSFAYGCGGSGEDPSGVFAKECPAVSEFCGDGVCNGNETCMTCEKDCGKCEANCGDGVCGAFEDCGNCPEDCGECQTASCKDSCGGAAPDGTCYCDEACLEFKDCCDDACSQCGICEPVCGDGACNGDETCESCPQDCGECPPPECGDGKCNGDENCETCSEDCGECKEYGVCGDGFCNKGENCSICPEDCGDCGECGDLTYEGCCDGDTVLWCEDGKIYSFDCRAFGGEYSKCGWVVDDQNNTGYFFCGGDGVDPNGQFDGVCPSYECGDGICQATENCENCSADCGECASVCQYGIDAVGCCSGSLLVWCSNGSNIGLDCSQIDMECGWDAENNRYACGGSGEDPSGVHPMECPVNKCGNGECEEGESCESCPEDCGECPPPECGDGKCNGDENCETCSDDCGECQEYGVCGDGFCNKGENCMLCPEDCGKCGGCDNFPQAGCCVDNVMVSCYDGQVVAFDCSLLESSLSKCGWVADESSTNGGMYSCGGEGVDPSGNFDGVCPAFTCGDGVCDAVEDCSTCPQDCGECASTCEYDISDKGCCVGSYLVICSNGSSYALDCSKIASDMTCGWDTNQGKYVCGGQGEDPSGTYPIDCPISQNNPAQ